MLTEVHTPTLFVVSERDSTLVTLNRCRHLCAPCQLQPAPDSPRAVPAAAKDHIAARASQWFTGHLDPRSTGGAVVATVPNPAAAPTGSHDGLATAMPS